MRLNQALEVISLTDVGQHRDHNEDALASDVEIGLVVLADGMGGYNAGEVASEIAVSTVMTEMKAALHNLKPGQFDRVLGMPAEARLMLNAAAHANAAIYHVSQSQPQCAGMGTTVLMGLFTNNQLLVGHIGDSRMYRLRHEQFIRLTEDHSLLQEQINAGMMTEAQALYSANKNLVTRALGIDPEVELTLNAFAVEVGDIYLLCSDGLTDLVEDKAILATLNMLSSDLKETAHKLVDMANRHGGKDNISVILVRVNSPFANQASWYDNFLNWIK